METPKRFSLVKPTTSTPFHIDFDWWQSRDNNWRVFLQSYLCSEHRDQYSGESSSVWIDWIDPETAEISKVDGIQKTLMDHCAKQADFLQANTTLVDSVFRILLANGNKPLTPNEFSIHMGRSADTILRTLSGGTVYRGIRPILS